MSVELPRDRRILIIGAGKVGADLAVLLADDNEVRIISRFSRPEVHERLRAAGVKTIRLDLTPDNVDELPDDAELVFFQHAFHARAAAEPQRAHELNTTLTGHLMIRFREAAGIVSAGTGNLYDRFPGEIITDRDYEAPHGAYGLSRYGAEVLMQFFSRYHHTPTAILRYTYGNGPQYGVLRRLIAIIEAGDPIPVSLGSELSIIAHRDLVRYTALAAAVCAVPPVVINCTGPEPVPLADLVDWICERGDYPAPAYEEGERRSSLLFRCERLVELLGPPQMSWQEMVDQALAAHREGVPIVGQS